MIAFLLLAAGNETDPCTFGRTRLPHQIYAQMIWHDNSSILYSRCAAANKNPRRNQRGLL